MTISVVPYEDPEQSTFTYTYAASPWTSAWWINQTLTRIPNDAVGWLVAQGWQITATTPDTSTVPETTFYSMQRESLDNRIILQSLLSDWVYQYNLANDHNTVRYNDIVEDWTETITSSQTHFTSQISEQTTHATAYIAAVDTLMDTVEGLAQSTTYSTAINDLLDEIISDYDIHAPTTRDFLIDLGATELARINEEYAASLSVQLQQLIDRGLYSSALAADITERNTRDKNEAITALNDRLMREKLENQHKLYDQQVSLRSRTLEGETAIRTDVHRTVAELTTTYSTRLDASTAKHRENMELTRYQLDERNKLLIGLYGFVERREDVAPPFENLISICTGLGDSGGGWVTP